MKQREKSKVRHDKIKQLSVTKGNKAKWSKVKQQNKTKQIGEKKWKQS